LDVEGRYTNSNSTRGVHVISSLAWVDDSDLTRLQLQVSKLTIAQNTMRGTIEQQINKSPRFARDD
jgi:hypothetical protein